MRGIRLRRTRCLGYGRFCFRCFLSLFFFVLRGRSGARGVLISILHSEIAIQEFCVMRELCLGKPRDLGAQKHARLMIEDPDDVETETAGHHAKCMV